MKILTTQDIMEKMHDFYKNGAKPPISLEMGTFSNHYGVKLGSCTDITGYPYSGKSLLLKEIIINSHLKAGLKHMLYLPDDGSKQEIISNLVHKISGKTFDKRFDNYLTEAEFYRFTTQIVESFGIIESSQRISPEELWLKSIELGYDCCSIDSWNYMNVEDGHKALSKVLSSRNMIAEKNNKHFFTIIHPKNPTQSDFDKNGNLKPPESYNLMGGSEWNNNAKSILVVHKESKESLTYQVYIRKVKPRIVGVTGTVEMDFHIPSQRFHQFNERGQPEYFYDNGFIQKENILSPNANFDTKTVFEEDSEDVPF